VGGEAARCIATQQPANGSEGDPAIGVHGDCPDGGRRPENPVNGVRIEAELTGDVGTSRRDRVEGVEDPEPDAGRQKHGDPCSARPLHDLNGRWRPGCWRGLRHGGISIRSRP
jgi:hypothetical protein